MNAFDFPLSFPQGLSTYLAILGLLISWNVHELAVQLGRIQPKEVRDVVRRLARARPILQRQRAAPWLFIYLSSNDSQSCAQCTKAHSHVYSGSHLREATAQIRCVNAHGCRCVVIPFTGQGPMAKRLRAQLNSQHGHLQLSERGLRSLIHQGENSGEHDRLACRLLHAMLSEETDPHAARETYVHAMAATPKGSTPLLQVAGYIRLADLLERSGNYAEAAHVTCSFLKAFSEKDRHLVLAEPQYDGIKSRQTRLVRALLSPPGKVSSL